MSKQTNTTDRMKFDARKMGSDFAKLQSWKSYAQALETAREIHGNLETSEFKAGWDARKAKMEVK